MKTTSNDIPNLNSPEAVRFYVERMSAYSSAERFGVVSRHTGQPVHVNHTKSPLPCWGGLTRRARAFGPKLAKLHLSATKANQQAAFHVNRPDATVYLLGTDWDVAREAIDGPARGRALAARFDADLSGRSFMEPSRGRWGSYNWIRVRRDEATVEEFTDRLNALNRTLSKRYGRKGDNDGVGFDAIKGTPWHLTPNPAYDPVVAHVSYAFASLDDRNAIPCPDWMYDPADVYRWHREHYRRGEFQRLEYLEPDVLHHGVLVTKPLHGIRNDGTEGEARWRAFWEWEGDDGNAIRSSQLWAIFGVTDDADDVTEPAPAQISATVTLPKAPRQSGRAWAMLRSEEKTTSMNGAAAVAIDVLGIDRFRSDPVAATLTMYRAYGAATGEDTPDRIRRATESADHFADTYDETKRGRLWFNDMDIKGDAAGLLNAMISDEELREFNRPQKATDECGAYWAKPRTSVTRYMLALSLCCVSKMILNDAGALSTEKLAGFIRHFGHSLNGSCLKAVLTLLARKGLITCLDPTYRFHVAGPETNGQKAKGRCRLWAFAPNAPLLKFIARYLPHRLSRNGRARYMPEGEQVEKVAKADAEGMTAGPLPSLSLGNQLFVAGLNDSFAVPAFGTLNGTPEPVSMPLNEEIRRGSANLLGGFPAHA